MFEELLVQHNRASSTIGGCEAGQEEARNSAGLVGWGNRDKKVPQGQRVWATHSPRVKRQTSPPRKEDTWEPMPPTPPPRPDNK